MAKKQRMKLEEVLNLTDDPDELLELLSNSDSLIARSKKELEFRQVEKNLLRKRLKQVAASTESVRATDHAIIRYLERVVGMDIEALKKEMVSKIPTDFEWSDDTDFVQLLDKDDMQYVLRDRLIISVCPIGKKDE